MKTTLILRDDLVRRAKARAAMRGQPLSRYMEESLERTLAVDEQAPVSVGDWLDTLPTLSRQAANELNAALDESDSRKVDPEMWA